MEDMCLEGMPLPFLLDEMNCNSIMNGVSSSASTHLLESFHAQQHAQQQQQLNQSYNFYNPQLHNFPAVSWSTTDPTLLMDQQQQQQPESLFSSGGGNLRVSCNSNRDENYMEIEAASFPTVQQLFHSRSCTGLHCHNHAGVCNSISAIPAEQMNDLHEDMTAMSGRCNLPDNALSSSSTMSSCIYPFSFCADGDGGCRVNASSFQSQWMEQMCSLSSDQYYSCVDALMMPKLVSDPFADSPQQQQPQRHGQQPRSHYTSSTSVNCLHEADSCGSSDRDWSTTSEEINWMNSTSCNNSELSSLANGGVGDDSVTGLNLCSSVVPVELSDEPIAAAADEVELVPAPKADHVQHHIHHRVELGAAAAPSGRLSWMAPSIGNVQTSDHVPTTTLDPLLLVSSGTVATSPTMQFINYGILSAPRSALGPFKPQHRPYPVDVLPASTPPFSFSASQNCSSSISPRYSSVHSMPQVVNPAGLVVDTCTSSGSSFYKDFHSFSSTRSQQHHGVTATPSSSTVPAAAGGVGVKEFNVGGGFEPRKDYCSDEMTLLSNSRKPTATSIEPQSVAARYRRKKISERVRILEKLIPGGNKMDTASMLDEATEYVKFLQLQVQLLESMGEPETGNIHGAITPAAFATAATTTTTTTNSSAPFHPHDNCKVDSSAFIGAVEFGSSHQFSRSSALIQQLTIAAAAASTPKSMSTPPLVLSEVLQEQLFKQKLCLVSLRQYCP